MIEGVFQDWFSPKVEMALDSSKFVAKNYFQVLERDVSELSNIISKRVNKLIPIDSRDDYQKISKWLREKDDLIVESDISITFFTKEGEVLIRLGSSESDQEPSYIKDNILEVFNSKKTISSPEKQGDREFLRIYSYLNLDTNNSLVMVTTKQVQISMTNALSNIVTASDEYRNFKSYRKPLDSGFSQV